MIRDDKFTKLLCASILGFACYGWSVGRAYGVTDETVTFTNLAITSPYANPLAISETAGFGWGYSFWSLWHNSFAVRYSDAVGTLKLTVRDSTTGRFVPSRLISRGKNGISSELSTEQTGRGTYQLPSGQYDLELAAVGYKTLKTHFAVDPQSILNVTVWLDPDELPEELRVENLRSHDRSHYALLHGHVIDSETGLPLKGVHVGLEHSGIKAQTDDRGYFLFYSPVREINAAEELPGSDNLVAELGGYQTYRRVNVTTPEGSTHFIIDMNPGKGVTERDDTHKLMLSPEELEKAQTETPGIEDQKLDLNSPTAREGSLQPLALIVPSTIRVGSNCSTKSTCTTFNTYSLDTYVKNGLEDEWISSWTSNSLKAGAIAYRSYGVYYVYHPISSNYDICNTTSCQVNDPTDTATSTNTATTDTAGMIVTDSSGSQPFFAEYAAENNDSSCADGFTGSPSANWSCMSDSVDAGQPFNGHGRGMCQWGSQRWALNQGKDYVWIVNHYYNNNGSPSGARSGVLQTSPSSGNQPPGIVLNPNGVSTIGWMFDTTDWTRTQGPGSLHDHDGDDYYADDWARSCGQTAGQPIYASISGMISLNPNNDGNEDYYGNSVVIFDETTHFAVRYAHLQEFAPGLTQGGRVCAGDYLGKVGNTGNVSGSCTVSPGAHLHIVVYKNVTDINSRPIYNTYFNSSSSTPTPTSYAAPFSYSAQKITDTNCQSGSSCVSGSTSLRNRDGGPPIHPPGSVIKIASDPTVYLIDPDNRKRPLSASALSQLYNQSTDARTSTNFNSWVITVAQDELDVYELGGSIFSAQPGNGQPFPDGKLISYGGEVSIVTGIGKRRPFVLESTFTGLGFNFCQVVNVSLAEYNSYPQGPPVDAMPLLTSSVNLSPAGPYIAGQNIAGTFTVKNVGYASIPFSSLGIGGRLNGSTVFDLNFVSTTLAAGSSYPYGSQARQLTSTGTYDFFPAYQESNGHWAISVPAASGVIRSRQITVTNTTTRTLTVASSNPTSGVSITVSPNDNNGQGSGTTQFTRTYNDNTSVNLTAPATASGNNFQKWQRDGSDWSTSTSTSMSMDANHTMTAVYTTPVVTRTLTITSSNPSSGVSITVSPNDNNGQGSGTTQFTRVYNNNTNMSLTAPSTAGGNNFQKWQLDGVDLTTSLLANFVMDANHTMTAVYTAPVGTRTLTVASSNPSSGVSITVTPNDNNNQGSGTTQFTRVYNNNTSVTVTAPSTASGNNFQKWQRDGSDWSTNQSTSVTMDANHTMTAVYTNPVVTRTLTVASSNPSSGVSITVGPNDNNGQGSGTTQFTRVYNNNTNMSLTAPSTAGGNNFQKWQLDGADLTTSLLANFVMDANHTITAIYVTPCASAQMTSPTDGSSIPSSTTFTWNTGTGNSEYWLAVGTTPGGSNVYSTSQLTGTSRTLSNLPSGTIYVRLSSRCAGSNTWTFNDYSYVVGCTSTPAQMTSPANGSNIQSTTTFTWNTGTGNSEYWLAVGTTPGGSNIYSTSQLTGTSRTLSNLPSGTIYVRLSSRCAGSNTWSFNDYSYVVGCTSTPAQMTSPTNGANIPSTTTFTWNTGTGNSEYWLQVGTTQGGSNIYSTSQLTGTSRTLSNLPSGTIYVRLSSRCAGSNTWSYNDYSYLVLNCASAQMTSPTNGANIPSTTTFTWNTGTGNSEYWLQVGTTLSGSDIYSASQLTGTSRTLSNLPAGNIYVTLSSRCAASNAWTASQYTYTGPDVRAQMISPENGTVLPSSIVTFTWSRGTGVSQYFLYVGNSQGSSEYFYNYISNGSTTISGIPTDGRTIYVRLWSLTSTAWTYLDYTYTACVNCGNNQLAQITSPANGTTFGSSAVTFNWNGGTGNNQYFLYVGNSLGSSEYFYNYISGGSTPVSGLPTDGRTIWVRIWSLNSKWVYIDYSYKAVGAVAYLDRQPPNDRYSMTALLVVKRAYWIDGDRGW